MNLAKRHYLNYKTINLKFLILPKVKILRQHLLEEKIKIYIFNLYIKLHGFQSLIVIQLYIKNNS